MHVLVHVALNLNGHKFSSVGPITFILWFSECLERDLSNDHTHPHTHTTRPQWMQLNSRKASMRRLFKRMRDYQFEKMREQPDKALTEDTRPITEEDFTRWPTHSTTLFSTCPFNNYNPLHLTWKANRTTTVYMCIYTVGSHHVHILHTWSSISAFSFLKSIQITVYTHNLVSVSTYHCRYYQE